MVNNLKREQGIMKKDNQDLKKDRNQLELTIRQVSADNQIHSEWVTDLSKHKEDANMEIDLRKQIE